MHDDPAVLLNSIRKAVKSKFSQAAIAQQTEDTNDKNLNNIHSDSSVNEEKFPLGFNTGGMSSFLLATLTDSPFRKYVK